MTAAPHSAADLPVRPGEDPWSDAELTELRIELEKEAIALRAELGESQAQISPAWVTRRPRPGTMRPTRALSCSSGSMSSR